MCVDNDHIAAKQMNPLKREKREDNFFTLNRIKVKKRIMQFQDLKITGRMDLLIKQLI